MSKLSSMSIDEVRARRTLCDRFIRELMATDDPRAPGAVEHYRKQQHLLDRRLTYLERQERQAQGIPEPEPVVVGLNSAVMFGAAQ